jgi:hypothetical protein
MGYSVVWVQWADAHTSEPGWLELDGYEDEGEVLVDTVGFLIPVGDAGSKDGHVSIWQTLCQGEGIHGFHVPVQMVREIKVLGCGGLETLMQ